MEILLRYATVAIVLATGACVTTADIGTAVVDAGPVMTGGSDAGGADTRGGGLGGDGGACGTVMNAEGCPCAVGSPPRTCYLADASTGAVGSCSSGQETCVAQGEVGGTWGPCVGRGTPVTCASQKAECGVISDGCGGMLSCDACPDGETCGGGGVPNICGTGVCVTGPCPVAACGVTSDPNCGTAIHCTCPSDEVCSADGQCTKGVGDAGDGQDASMFMGICTPGQVMDEADGEVAYCDDTAVWQVASTGECTPESCGQCMQEYCVQYELEGCNINAYDWITRCAPQSAAYVVEQAAMCPEGNADGGASQTVLQCAQAHCVDNGDCNTQ